MLAGALTTLSLSHRAQALKPSPTLAMTAKARAMQAQGMDVVIFAAGEPDFNTPEPICRAAIQALNEGKTKYTPSVGMPALREAVARQMVEFNRIKGAKPEEVVVSVGAKHSIANTLLAILDPGDEVILLAPFWMTYADQVTLAGGIPVIVSTRPEDDFVPSYEALKEAVTARTKAIIINSPSNPTGAGLPRKALKEIAALALRFGLYVISDEIYERLVYDDFEQCSIASLGEDIAAQTITITGCSKTYSMTGWRIGFAHAPLAVAKAMGNLQDQVTSNPVSFAQFGALAALALPAEEVEKMRQVFDSRRRLLVERLNAIPGVSCRMPKGAFYAFPDVSAFLGGEVRDDLALADHLLEKAHIAVVPGSVFYGPGHIRLSYACSPEDIEKGVERLSRALADLRS